MTIALAIALTLGILVFVLFIRGKDVPEPVPVSPLQHLEDRKAAIYDNLRDLQFEYRVGKLSDADYQQMKLSLQKELAGVLAEMETTAKTLGLVTKQSAPAKRAEAVRRDGGNKCPHCGAAFAKPMKFCGECGKAMA
jgi:rRNA maturation endonuclease Nob1